MRLKEFLTESKRSKINDFLRFVQKELELEKLPRIIIIDDPEFSINNKTFGCFDVDNETIRVQISQRHPLDIFRTLAHEIVHYTQKQSGDELDGSDGSPHENEANTKAGILLRKYAHQINDHGYETR